ncbi:MAG TPA: DUF1816 domain-containing protein [Kamptonema sp.]|nr:DUF1816 domain-containing protein [Kamptonema sp.]
MKELQELSSTNIIDFLERLGMAVWIEVITQSPHCIYYFGPFTSRKEAQLAISGYVEDLEKENAKVIAVDVKRGRPIKRTICEADLGDFYESIFAQTSSYFVSTIHR